MALKEQLFVDLKEAMKAKDTTRKNTIQLIRAGVLQIEKDSQTELDDSGVFDVIVKELKKRRDALADFEKANRTDLIDETNREIEVLLGYLPEQLSEDELREIIRETITETDAHSMKDMGKVMKALTPKIKGKADNKLVSGFVKEMLAN
ncbi:MAG: GatB/YqeY domain-containing protein [Firmicutes bacterium]|nr:GatB/YqeY domain-containing protein [Bacillota bacterium]MBQ7241412.1 GatB/YqeY domain-containing protein [Bacillota bacterium]MBR0104967.1 GatB/YqeY domain-containing protein [Bacillota bacterium]MBR2594190.1 GatB/YqeY domain-containing protein [Bacillota bacterium]